MPSNDSPIADPDAYFWQVAAQLQSEDSRVTEAKKVFERCVCVNGEFLATYIPRSHTMVVKLTDGRVRALTAEGVAVAFTAMRKTFDEWASVGDPQMDRWEGLLREAVALALGPQPA